MTRLAAATRAVERACPDLREIVRTDVDESGALVLTAVAAEGTRWFTHDGSELVELDPAADSRLPLAELLTEHEGLRVLSYRPGRRLVLEASRGGKAEVLKGHRARRSARAAACQAIAEEAMGAGAFRVPRLLRRDPAREALVFELLDGRPADLGPDAAEAFRRIGARLAAFRRHEADVRSFRIEDEFDVLERWAGKVLVAVGELPAGWARARALLADAAAPLPVGEVGLAHRDLHDGQLHRTGADIAVLDFDLLCRTDTALDPANLIAHLHLRALQGENGATPASARACAESFLGALGDTRPDFAPRLAFFEASSLLRLALVYVLRPRWSGLVGELVSAAEERLRSLASTR